MVRRTDEGYEALEESIYLLGEKVGAAGRTASERDPYTGGSILGQLRSAHGDLECAILAAMNVMHDHGAAPQGAAGLLGFNWRTCNPRDRERFEELWKDLRASNVGDPALRRRLRELLAAMG